MWDAPADNGGQAIDEYVVSYSLHGEDDWQTANIEYTGVETMATITELANGASYDFRIYAVTSADNGDAAIIANVTPATDVPNNGDANNDGIHDKDQTNVMSFVNPVTGKYAALAVDANCIIESAVIKPESDNTVQDSGYDYPAGLMNFTVDCGTPGFTAEVKQYTYGASPTDVIVRKYNPKNAAYFTITDATIERPMIGGEAVTVVTYEVTDGGALDIDGVENGVIVDPVGIAGVVVEAPNTGFKQQHTQLHPFFAALTESRETNIR